MNTRVYIGALDYLSQRDKTTKLALTYTRLAQIGSFHGGRVHFSDVMDATQFKRRTAKIYLQKLIDAGLAIPLGDGYYRILSTKKLAISQTGVKRPKYVKFDNDVLFSYSTKTYSEFSSDVMELYIELQKAKQAAVARGYTTTDPRTGARERVKDGRKKTAHDLVSLSYAAVAGGCCVSTAANRRKKQTLAKYEVGKRKIIATGCKFETYNQSKEEVIERGSRLMNFGGKLTEVPISRRHSSQIRFRR